MALCKVYRRITCHMATVGHGRAVQSEQNGSYSTILQDHRPQMVTEVTYCNRGNRWLVYIHFVSLTVTSCSCNASPKTDVKRGIGFIIHIPQQGVSAADIPSICITVSKHLLMQHGSGTEAASGAQGLATRACLCVQPGPYTTQQPCGLHLIFDNKGILSQVFEVCPDGAAWDPRPPAGVPRCCVCCSSTCAGLTIVTCIV
jgi:hypothetical protein